MAKSKYETHVLPNLDKITEWAKEGISAKAIAKSLGVSDRAFRNYLVLGEQGDEMYLPLFQAYTHACEEPNKEVETALFHLACGYNAQVQDYAKVKKKVFENGKVVAEYEEIVPVTKEVHVPANVMAQEFWLTNRKPGEWKYKPEATSEVEEGTTGIIELPPVMNLLIRQSSQRRRKRMSNVIWTPQPRQAALMSRFEDEALYGGAAGGGKSDCALAEALRQVNIPHYRGLILRKTYPQLSEMIDRSQEIYKPAFPSAKYNDQKHVWTFPSGAKIYFGSMQHTQDRTNYQGKRYDYIDFDELTQFLWEEYSYMFSRNRPNGPGTRCYIRAQANPGGIGHGWVKERFIIPAKPMDTIWEPFKIRYPDGHEEIRWKSRIFVPSTVFDNQILLNNNPDYLTALASMPEAERNALLYGDWDTFAGQVFTEWRNDSEHYRDRINTHVIEPFDIPKHWPILCSMDWGYSKPFSIGWWAFDEDGRMYRVAELYGCTETPNTGVKWEIGYLAKKIKEIEADDPNLKNHKISRVGDPAIWQANGSESIGEFLERQCLYFEKGDNARISGKMQVHHRLAFDEEGYPMMYIFSTCRQFIRTFPVLVYSQTHPEDVDTDGEDHSYDETRYACMQHPLKARENKAPKLVIYDPLSTDDMKSSKYSWYDKY